MAQLGGSTALPSKLLSGRIAIVTGVSRGIGRATVLRLAEGGGDVVINYIQNEAAAEEAARQARVHGVQALPVRADVADVNQAAALVQKTVEQFDRVDLLVANAGVWEGAPVEEMSEEIWDRVIDANLKGTWTTCRAFVPYMKRQRSGAIIIVSSTAGQRGEAGYSNYAASKGGQISFTKSLAAELAPGIRVNSVAPGWVDTELNEVVFGDAPFKQKIVDTIPLGRVATADDIALAIVFLASDWAASITGEILNVNGGSVLCG